MIKSEVLNQLLRIQAKYEDEHPCLCTSRFRHVLHQLDHDKHKKLAGLCLELQQIKHDDEDNKVAYGAFIDKIFEYDGVHEDNGGVDLAPKLERILARFVSDYRAIFAIEEDHGHGGLGLVRSASSEHCVDHEHRKRHEEEDDCPEEIKLM